MNRIKRWWHTKWTTHHFLAWHEAEAKAMNAKMRYYFHREQRDAPSVQERSESDSGSDNPKS